MQSLLKRGWSFGILGALVWPALGGIVTTLTLFTAPTQAETGKVDSSCTYNGIPLQGKVQVVDAFPDIKVKKVSSFPDLKVEDVSSFPDACGKWQFVDSFPDFKIQYVDSFPDIEIEFVNSFPGLP